VLLEELLRRKESQVKERNLKELLKVSQQKRRKKKKLQHQN